MNRRSLIKGAALFFAGTTTGTVVTMAEFTESQSDTVPQHSHDVPEHEHHRPETPEETPTMPEPTQTPESPSVAQEMEVALNNEGQQYGITQASVTYHEWGAYTAEVTTNVTTEEQVKRVIAATVGSYLGVIEQVEDGTNLEGVLWTTENRLIGEFKCEYQWASKANSGDISDSELLRKVFNTLESGAGQGVA